MSDQKESSILLRDLHYGMKNISTKFIVLEIGQGVKTKDGNEVRTIRVADKTGSINLSVWNENGKYMQSGDIFQLIKGNVTIRNNGLMLNVGRCGQLLKIGEFCLHFVEIPFLSEPNSDLITKINEINQPKKKHFDSNGHKKDI